MLICFTQFSKNRINGTHGRESNKKDATKQKANICKETNKGCPFSGFNLWVTAAVNQTALKQQG